MELIEIAGYLPDTVKKATHKTAAKMEQFVQVLAEENAGKLSSFEISNPGTALLFVVGDQAKQAIIREFKKLQNVVVQELSALAVQRERNKKEQERANNQRAALAKARGK